MRKRRSRRSRKRQKLLSFVLTFILVFSSLVNSVNAAPKVSAPNNVSELKQAVDMQLDRFNKNGLNNYKGTIGIFYNLNRSKSVV